MRFSATVHSGAWILDDMRVDVPLGGPAPSLEYFEPGVYDVTPDWNPVLGPVAQVPGLLLAYGFSGHGFKLSPAVGRVLAQAALGLPTDVPLAPYALERFRGGRLLSGRYGSGAVS